MQVTQHTIQCVVNMLVLDDGIPISSYQINSRHVSVVICVFQNKADIFSIAFQILYMCGSKIIRQGGGPN